MRTALIALVCAALAAPLAASEHPFTTATRSSTRSLRMRRSPPRPS